MTGETLSLEAVLHRKLKKACALKATQGEGSRQPLLILHSKMPAGLGPKSAHLSISQQSIES